MKLYSGTCILSRLGVRLRERVRQLYVSIYVMNPENLHAEQTQKNSVFRVTPLSKYLAMVLFIILPFLGGWIGYSLAPERVVEVTRSESEREMAQEIADDSKIVQNTGAISLDLMKYIKSTQYGVYKGISVNGDFLAYIPYEHPVLRIVDLKTNQISAEIASNTLRFLNLEYDLWQTQFLPNNRGDAVFIDVTEGCACEKENEGILVIDKGQIKIFPLPNVVDFEWLSGIDLKYRYKLVIDDPSVCSDVEGMCIGVRVADEWTVDQVNINATQFLESWDGYNKLQ